MIHSTSGSAGLLMAPLNVVDIGLSLGIVWGFAVFMLGAVSSIWRKSQKAVEIFSKVYIGFRPTPLGSLTGAFWGFIDGLVSGMIIAWVANYFIS